MQVLSTSHASAGLPSPTLTNPDMILPDSSASSSSSPVTLTKHQPAPSPPVVGAEDYGFSGLAPRVESKTKTTMYGHSENDAPRRHNEPARSRSKSEKLRLRGSFESDHRQSLDVPVASSPTLEGGLQERIYTASTEGDFDNGEGTYTTPGILEEDEDDPRSHAAMTRRAEEILANAKKRLTVGFNMDCLS